MKGMHVAAQTDSSLPNDGASLSRSLTTDDVSTVKPV